jgi:pilus assembly protein CpaE
MDPRKKAILVGCDEAHYLQVRKAMVDCSVDVEAEFPDARSAVDDTRLSQGEERICVMHVRSADDLQQLKWLSESFIGRPLMALVDGDSSPGLLFAVNAAGAGQIVPLPLRAEDLDAALHCIQVRHASPQPIAARRVIAVSGVTGGCGATTIAINLAYEIAEYFKLSCILVELAPMGMLATCLDVDARHSTYDLLCDMRSVDVHLVEKTLSKITDRFHILPAPFGESEPPTTSPADVLRLLDYVKQLADVVVMDLPTNRSDCCGEAFVAADQIVLVAEQAVPSLRALGYARERLDQAEGIRRQTLVINRYDPSKEGFNVTHLQRLMRTPQLVTIANDYPSVSASLNEGRPLRLQAPGSRVLADIKKLAHMLVSSREQPQQLARESRGLGRLVRNQANRLGRAVQALLRL